MIARDGADVVVGIERQARLQESGLPFAKMSGSGNDFVMIDNRDGLLAAGALPEFTRRVCRRGIGLGADGVVTIEPLDHDQPDADFRWRYINADGSDGEMCGNGAMCGARFAMDAGIAPQSCVFQTPSGLVHAEVAASGPMVRIAMPDAGPLDAPVELKVLDRTMTFHSVRVGVPHTVGVVDDADGFADATSFAAWGKAIRQHPHFAPEGVNVNLIHPTDGNTLRMRTYERGVEAETLACGTGSVASAIVAMRELGMTPPLRVITSSGRPLQVDFRWDGETSSARDIYLAGEARFIATGHLDPEGWWE